MRRNMVWVAVLAVVLGGCKGDAFSAQADVVATAEGQELKAERVAEILGGAKGITLEPRAVEFVANLWIDYTLFAQAVASGELKTDSTTIAEALWPGIADARSRRWHDSVVARRSKVTDAQIDSAYSADQSRAVQHILVTAEKAAPADIRAAARGRPTRSSMSLVPAATSPHSRASTRRTRARLPTADSIPRAQGPVGTGVRPEHLVARTGRDERDCHYRLRLSHHPPPHRGGVSTVVATGAVRGADPDDRLALLRGDDQVGEHDGRG